jgi:hypothetical protein
MFKVQTVKKPIVDKKGNQYIGMNKYAAKELGVSFNHPSTTITISQGLSGIKRKKTILHEETEARIMKHHHRYSYAHRFANYAERSI